MIIAIDGPAGSGKSTVARKLANRLGFIHLNSGALFRAVALKAEAKGLGMEDDAGVGRIAEQLDFRFELVEGNATRLLVNSCDFSEQLHSEAAGKLASRIGLLPSVRKALLGVQRRVAEKHSVVVEGRDAGTVVFPDAEAKFFLDAPVEVRAKRRLLDEAGGDPDSVSFEEVIDKLKKRDHRDTTRDIAPGVKANDALLVDTEHLNADEVVEHICNIINAIHDK